MLCSSVPCRSACQPSYTQLSFAAHLQLFAQAEYPARVEDMIIMFHARGPVVESTWLCCTHRPALSSWMLCIFVAASPKNRIVLSAISCVLQGRQQSCYYPIVEMVLLQET